MSGNKRIVLGSGILKAVMAAVGLIFVVGCASENPAVFGDDSIAAGDYEMIALAANGGKGKRPPLCTPETDFDFCARLGGECDLLSGTGNCGTARTDDCGSCGA